MYMLYVTIKMLDLERKGLGGIIILLAKSIREFNMKTLTQV